MQKNILSLFMIIMLVVAFVLYLYAKNTLFNLTTPSEKEYVESKINPYGWVDYQSDSDDYQVKFPNTPQKAKDESIDLKTKVAKKTDMLVSETQGKVFMLSVITFDNNSFIESKLNALVESMKNSRADNKLKSFKHGLHNNYKDADFVITNPQYTILGRAIINNNKIYVLSSIGTLEKDIKDEFNFFVQSFKIK